MVAADKGTKAKNDDLLIQPPLTSGGGTAKQAIQGTYGADADWYDGT